MFEDAASAAKAGEKRYFPGTACSRGHVAPRLVKSGLCVECNRENAINRYRTLRAVAVAKKEKTQKLSAEFAHLATKRSEAKARGDVHYFTGYKCKHGHLAPRLTKSGSCTTCCAVLNSGYTEANPERARQYHQISRERHREKRNAVARNWRLKNKHRVAEYNAAYRSLLWGETNSGRATTLAIRTPKWASKEAIAAKYREARELAEQTGVEHHVDHIIPLCGPLVCGLHVENNLNVVQGVLNLQKARSFEGSTPSSVWHELDDEGKEAFAKAAFAHFRSVGFPYFETPKKPVDQTIFSARAALKRGLIKDGVVTRSAAGASVVNSYFPHMMDVRCNNQKTPMEAFLDDRTLIGVIEYRMRYGDYMSNNGLRKAIFTYGGVQRASNFRPTAAAALYEHYAPENAAVFDPCAGWGGRLLGAAMAKNVVRYTACDPSTKTYDGLLKLAEYAKKFVSADLRNCGVEDINLAETFDMAFTSPPYFNHEQYADEMTQSYVKFPTPEAWRDGFLRVMFKKTLVALKPGAVFAVNIANVKNYPDLENDTVVVGAEEGFVLEAQLQLELAAMGKAKYEPIFVFRKPT